MKIVVSKYLALILTFIITTSCVINSRHISGNEQIAEWVEIIDDSQEAKPFIELQNQEVPTKVEVGVMPYPTSKLLMVDKFYCADNTTFIGLVSKSKPDVVIDWYQNNINNYGSFKYDDRHVFIKDTKIFNPETDASPLIENTSVSISSLQGLFKKVLPKYNTYIEINYKPTNCNSN